MEIISNIVYFIIAIGVLVAIHEFGHFIAARLTGMRAEIFSIGMGQRLFGYNKINGFTFGKLPSEIDLGNHTDYRVAIFPIGGYVKISGMIDESFDTEFAGKPPENYEFRSKNTFQKLFVLSAGVLMNLILAVAIFSFITFYYGSTELATNVIGKVESNSILYEMGLRSGDKIISINNYKINSWNQLVEKLTFKEFGKDINVKLIRDNNLIDLKLDGTLIIKSLSKKEPLGIYPGNIKTYIEEVIKGNPAEKLGLKSGDTILFCNNVEINSINSLKEELTKHKSEQVILKWKRGDQIFIDSVITNSSGLIGVKLAYSPITNISYGIFESIYIGFRETINSLELLIKSIIQIFKGNLSFKESIAGPILIIDMAGEQANRGLVSFLSFIALLSISLAFMNILPFPALDGGHLVFVLIEGIMRREIPVKVKIAFQQGGIIILLLFMAFVFYNDITRLWK